MNSPSQPPHRAASRSAAFRHALDGCRQILCTQRNAWIHAGATIAVVVLGGALALRATDWALLAMAIGLVWTAEALNTAVEAAVDLASPERNPLAKIAKDSAAAAVLAAALTAVVIGLVVLGPPLWEQVAGQGTARLKT